MHTTHQTLIKKTNRQYTGMLPVVLLAIAILASTPMAAQQAFATLEHAGALSAFYGSSALQQALAAAEDGDAITLSSGYFDMGGQTIGKAVSIRGNGAEDDATAGTEKTNLTGSFSINVPSSSPHRLSLIGVTAESASLRSDNVRIEKSIITSLTLTGSVSNSHIINCKMTTLSIGSTCTQNNFLGCIVGNDLGYGMSCNQSVANTFMNCYIVVAPNALSSNHYYNCILYYTNWTYNSDAPALVDAQNVYNCIGIAYTRGGYARFFSDNAQSHHLYNATNKNDIFETGYQLKSYVVSNYVSYDGTQIGIYGGQFPYTMSVRRPGMGRVTVSHETNTSGMLEVQVESVQD